MASLPQLPAEETPKLSYRTARHFELREASFSAEEDEAINKWVYAQIETKKKQLEILHTKKTKAGRSQTVRISYTNSSVNPATTSQLVSWDFSMRQAPWSTSATSPN